MLGAVNIPVEETDPPVAVQVTAVFVEPVTVALNCAVPLVVVVALAGETLTLTVAGSETFTLALALLVGSETLVAVIVSGPAELGALYRPVVDTVPRVARQVAAVLVQPLTVAPNCFDAPVERAVLVGATEIETVVDAATM